MARVIIDTDSAEDTAIALQFAEEHGFNARADDHRVLTTKDMVHGIGRKATDAELEEYLLKGENSPKIDIDEVFERFK